MGEDASAGPPACQADGMESDTPTREEGDVSAVVSFLCGLASAPLAVLVAPWIGLPLGLIAMSLGSWHAARGERPVFSSLAVPLGLAGVVAAGWLALT